MIQTLHATCVAFGPDAILILGASGRGKSRLALMLIEAGASLLADDRVYLDEILASAPPQAPGTRTGYALLEVRGLGIVELLASPPANVRLVVDLDAAHVRLPDRPIHTLTGLPLLALDPADPAAVARVRMALECACGRVRLFAG